MKFLGSKDQGFTLSLGDLFLGKPQRGRGVVKFTPSLLRVNCNFINSYQTNIGCKMNGFLKMLFSHFWFFHYSKINLTFVKSLFLAFECMSNILGFLHKCTSSYCSVENWISIFSCIKEEITSKWYFSTFSILKWVCLELYGKTSIVKDKFLNIISISVVK